MASLFKKALVDCFGRGGESFRSNIESNDGIYDCCYKYWLPIDERMWTGEIDFIYIDNWSEDVEFDFTGDDDISTIRDINTTRGVKRTTRPAVTRRVTRPTSYMKTRSSVPLENWENDLFPESFVNGVISSWEDELYTDLYMTSFFRLKESWEDELLF